MTQDNGAFRTVSRIFAILRLLSKKSHGLSFTEMMNEFADIPKSSMHNLLKQMASHGYVYYNDATKLYSIGGGMIELASSIVHHFTVKPLARPYIEDLGTKTGEDIYLGIVSGDELVYIDKVKGTHPIRYDIPVGTRRQFYCTSMGKLYLASMKDDELNAYFQKKQLVRMTERTMTDPAQIREHLKAVRTYGLSISYEENMDGIVGIAAPVLDQSGKMAAGVVISIPTDRAGEQRLDFLANHVKETAEKITNRMGGQPWNRGHGMETAALDWKHLIARM
ncbi:IclR family transcriptional regulator [Paenibacillus sp. JMULE4]|uniref:IclR family transcriptional regulator n=1 Tax=Paenibacillus sp. JMULE4 TaxID=2518342 RepID=UPI0015762715|nr:IclR family transcriptional regulator [Paenibacillus sp. JMULE4]NTZ16530.1 IclR family transcriptional regulator [Paenibacillus sp. JMULE4]